MSAARYPENLMSVAGAGERSDVPEEWRRFFDLRELVLLDYGYNTARAYWGDLDEWFRWAVERGKDVLALDDRDVRQYVALLRRRRYSESTIRRRRTSLNLLRRAVADKAAELKP